jgi:hypothetical protein
VVSTIAGRVCGDEGAERPQAIGANAVTITPSPATARRSVRVERFGSSYMRESYVRASAFGFLD